MVESRHRAVCQQESSALIHPTLICSFCLPFPFFFLFFFFIRSIKHSLPRKKSAYFSGGESQESVGWVCGSGQEGFAMQAAMGAMPGGGTLQEQGVAGKEMDSV